MTEIIKMVLITISYTVACGLVFNLFCKKGETLFKNEKNIHTVLIIVLIFAFILRLAFSYGTGFSVDVNLFKYWGYTAYDIGVSGLYNQDVFLDYPPGYIYVLYFLNFIRDAFSLKVDGPIFLSMMKLPSMIADIIAAVFIFKIAKKYQGASFALILSSFYALAPAVIFNSAVWGQVDGLYALIVVLAIYFAMEDKVEFAAITYGIGIVTKPQVILFGPVLLFYILSKKDFKKFLKAVSIGALVVYLLTLPITKGYDILAIYDFYMNTFSGYEYFTVNAYNIYMILKLNWKSLLDFGLSSFINVFGIIFILLLSAYHFFTSEKKEKYFVSANIIIILFFNICTMMHERYIFPTLLITIIIVAITGNKKYFYLFLGMQIFTYLNAAIVYSEYAGVLESNYIYYNICSLILIAFSIYFITLLDFQKLKNIKVIPELKLAVIVLISTVFTFTSLGSTSSPQTFYQTQNSGESYIFLFDESEYLKEIYTFSGMGDENAPLEGERKINSNFTFYYLDEFSQWQEIGTLQEQGVFTWQILQANNIYTSQVLIMANDKNQVLNEVGFYNSDDELIIGTLHYDAVLENEYSPKNTNDEQEIITKDTSYYSQTYFDEIYFARTAYELVNDYSIYETSHPHFGKIIIAVGISIFGMTPFGYRFMGAVFGILIILAMYFLAKELFKNKNAGVIASFLVAFDCMRYTQSRIATTDTFLVFFMILTFYFMLKYKNVNENENKSLKKEFIYLFLSGVFMAFSFSVKWNGAYAMIGLCLFFFYTLYKKYTVHKNKNRVIKTIAFCFFAFVFSPIIIYAILFSPVLVKDSISAFVSDIIRWQENMFSYHSQLVSEHFFSSKWYTWIFMIKPIWYSVTRFSNGTISTISSMGNILIWWAMPFSLIYAGVKGVKEKNDKSLFIILGYFACLLPWALISRLTFIYHYYPAVIFGILAVCFVLERLAKDEKTKKFVYIYLALSFVVFIIYLPVIGGFSVGSEYIENISLFNTWYFK